MVEQIYLREITFDDIPRINQWRHTPELVAQLADTYRYINLETDEQWFANYLENRSNNIRLAVCLATDHRHIGNVYLMNIDAIIRSAVFHIFIGDASERGKHYGEQATRLCLQHGFYDQNLQRISLTVLASNLAAIKLYEKCGFVTEGTLRRAAFKNGEYVDLLTMAVLREQYKKS